MAEDAKTAEIDPRELDIVDEGDEDNLGMTEEGDGDDVVDLHREVMDDEFYDDRGFDCD